MVIGALPGAVEIWRNSAGLPLWGDTIMLSTPLASMAVRILFELPLPFSRNKAATPGSENAQAHEW